ncbi:MAG: response regulator [Desulfobacterales bacterium]|nr:response regulator [Desulfobacterales bacterium]
MNQLLFVDDEHYYLKGVERMLHHKQDEWRLFFAGGVDEAVALTRIHPFDVIITDLRMPEKSGFDLLAYLQKTEYTMAIPVIILTGDDDRELKRKALDSGATDLLNKPIDPEDLVARITSALRLKSYQDEILRQNMTLETKVRERTLELEFLHHDLVWRLAKAGERRDEETGNHVVRVSHFSRMIAEALNLPPGEVELIFLTAPLHDLGKIGIPDGILLKQGRLSPGERAIMKQHCQIGADILLEQPKGMEAFYAFKTDGPPEILMKDEVRQYAATIAMSHHERWDGKGYPNGLKGEDIPLAGRIVAFADVYDALRSERPYKPAYPADTAWQALKKSAGSHLDPNIFKAIQDLEPAFESIQTTYND